MQLKAVEEAKLRQQVQRIADAQEKLQPYVQMQVAEDRKSGRDRACGSEVAHFTSGYYVLVVRVTKQRRRRKLMSSWTRSWHVVSDDREHVHIVERVVIGKA